MALGNFFVVVNALDVPSTFWLSCASCFSRPSDRCPCAAARSWATLLLGNLRITGVERAMNRFLVACVVSLAIVPSLEAQTATVHVAVTAETNLRANFIESFKDAARSLSVSSDS